LRTIDFCLGTPGADICARTGIPSDDLVDLLNGLMDAGYVETNPPVEKVEVATFEHALFEVNPSYVFDLKEAIARR
jgi:hypothetical protein